MCSWLSRTMTSSSVTWRGCSNSSRVVEFDWNKKKNFVFHNFCHTTPHRVPHRKKFLQGLLEIWGAHASAIHPVLLLLLLCYWLYTLISLTPPRSSSFLVFSYFIPFLFPCYLLYFFFSLSLYLSLTLALALALAFTANTLAFHSSTHPLFSTLFSPS